MKILVVAAHPDDEVLGCGGYMARHSQTDEVFTVIITEGCSSQVPREACSSAIAAKKAAALEANRILGSHEVIFGDFPDMRLENTDHIRLNAFLEDILRDIRPEVILTHHDCDLNTDHREIFKSVSVAARPVKRSPSRILLFETPSATEWQGYDLRHVFVPNVFVDIEPFFGAKLEAFRCYGTEARLYPHSRSEEGLRAYAAFRGLGAGLRLAEAFCLYRSIEE